MPLHCDPPAFAAQFYPSKTRMKASDLSDAVASEAGLEKCGEEKAGCAL
jgi:hypothetical protein